MIFPHIHPRTSSLPSSTPERLMARWLDAWSSLTPRWTPIFPRNATTTGLAPGYITLIVVLVIALLANITLVGYFLWRRHTRRFSSRSPFPRTYMHEKRQLRSWQPYGSEWFGRKATGEESRSLVAGYSSRMPNITISRPISNATVDGPTPIFSTNQRDTLHSIGIMELPDNSSQHSPEAIYDPFTHSRSRSNSLAESSQSGPISRSTSPRQQTSRSRNSSISSNHSRSASYTRQGGRPLATNSYSYARNRSPSNGPSLRGTYNPANPLPETVEEYSNTNNTKTRPQPKSTTSSSSSSPTSIKSSLTKSLPPPPPPESRSRSRSLSGSQLQSQQHQILPTTKSSLSYTPTPAANKTKSMLSTSAPSNSRSTPYSSFIATKPQFDFADYEVLHETTQVIDILIAEPLDIPQGPLTPFGEREAKAGAALGHRSDWYKSPGTVERGTWLV